MMKKHLLAALFLLFALLPCAGQRSSCIPVRSLDEKDLAFGAGETLKYSIHYKWGPINADVASATLSLDSLRIGGRKVLNAKIFAKNAKAYDPFFKMREDFRSWFTADGLEPVRFTRDTKEGNWFSVNDYSFDWDARPPHILASLDHKRKGPREVELPLTGCTFDVLSLFYYARNLDVGRTVPEKKYPLTFAIDDDICNIYFIFRGRETISVKGIGRVRALKFTVKLVEGDVFGDDVEAAGDMWFSDDDNHLLLLFETPVKVGKVRGRLSGWSGLSHEFSSIVK